MGTLQPRTGNSPFRGADCISEDDLNDQNLTMRPKSVLLLIVASFALLAFASAWCDPEGDRPITCGNNGEFCCKADRAICCTNGRNNCCSVSHPVCCPDSDVCCTRAHPFCGKDGMCYENPIAGKL